MRRTLTIALTLLTAVSVPAQTPTPVKAGRGKVVQTGESADAPNSLGTKLKSDLATANAAARAGLSRLKTQAIAKPPTQEQKLGLAAHAAGVDQPCDRTLFNVEGAAANFTIQPGQLILLNGCFKGSSNAEVRISGNFPPYGYLLLGIQDRGDGYFYGQMPDVTGVPDQPVSISIRFLSDGFTTSPRNGFFYAKRQTWEVYVDDRVCRGLRTGANKGTPIVDDWSDGPLCVTRGAGAAGIAVAAGSDAWFARSGYRLTKFWWMAVTSPGDRPVPTSVRPSDDGSGIVVTFPESTWYGAYRVRIEGPAGPAPY